MEDPTTYQAVRIGDTADWRLVCVMSARGIGAWLRHVDPMQPVATLFEERWEPDSDKLLERLESAVYDHPQVLDDFTADIAVVAPHSVWIPAEVMDDDEERGCEIYTDIYGGDASEVMLSPLDDKYCAYTLVPGLNAFLQRTFAGASVHPHLAVLARRFGARSSDMPSLYIDVREQEADFLAFDGHRMIMASTLGWNAPDDIMYHIFNIMDIYGLDPKATGVSLSGIREIKNDLVKELRKHITYVMLTMLPTVGAKTGMPVCGAMLMRN